jgi:RNA polymerase sigma-B factor
MSVHTAPFRVGPPPTGQRNAVGAVAPTMGSRAREDMELLVRYHKRGDRAAREELVERMLPVVRQLARRYQRGSEQLEDLVQVGAVGLVKAIDGFDVDRGSPFMRYAVPTILGEIKRYFRDTGWAAHVPRGMQERVMEVKGAIEELSSVAGRSPSPGEVAEKLGMEREEVLEALEAATAYAAISLDAPRSNEEGERESFAETVGQEDESYELVEDIAAVIPALDVLPERERLIVHLRFNEELTQSEIAERIGVSQMHVSRLLRRALERVRTVAAAERRRPRELERDAAVA